MAAKLAVLGCGAWGTALACVADSAGLDTVIWSRSAEITTEINTQRTNRKYLDDLRLPGTFVSTVDLATALRDVDVVLLSVPTQSLASFLAEMPDLSDSVMIVTTCKGIDRSSKQLPTAIVAERFPNNPVAALSGPSFAVDVVAGLPTAVTIASSKPGKADVLAQILSTSTFRCYASDDLVGVELGGALKNVLAIAVGAARGMGLGASAEAALIARGFAEITRLATALGAKPHTLAGLSGLGDLVLTCSSTQSRNFTYGMALGRAENLDGLKLAEGAFTAGVALQVAREQKIEVPITEAIVNVLEKRLTAPEAVHALLTRPIKREN